jgi:hypothetical protein
MTDKGQAVEVDLQVLDDATAALGASIRDMDAMARGMLDASYTIHPAAFTFLDPGALKSYANVRQYIINFLATMESRFGHLAEDLQAVSQSYRQSDTGSAEGMADVGRQLDGAN